MEESRILKGVTTSSYCFLCDKKLPNINKVQRHYNSPEHDKNLKWVKLNIFNYFEAPSPSSQESFYCFVCRSNFASEQLLKIHVKEFPHSILAKIKSNLVRDGITEEFAVPMKKKNMYCIICDAQLQHPFNASQHLISKAHKDLLCTWKKCLPAKKDISLDDNRWFHCRTCEVNLDGTTCAGKHHANHKSLVTPSHPSEELKVHFGTLSHIVTKPGVGASAAEAQNNDGTRLQAADSNNEKNVTSQNHVSVTVPLIKNHISDQNLSPSNFRSKVVKRKSAEVEQRNIDAIKREVFVELQVLDEVRVLLREVNNQNAPLTEILKRLEKFNKELVDKEFSERKPVQVKFQSETPEDASDDTSRSTDTKTTDEILQFGTTVENFMQQLQILSIEDLVCLALNYVEKASVAFVGYLSGHKVIPKLNDLKDVVTAPEDFSSNVVPDNKESISKITYSRTELLRLRSRATHICINEDLLVILKKLDIFMTDDCKNCISSNDNFARFIYFFIVFLFYCLFGTFS